MHMTALNLHLVACNHSLTVVFERTAVQRNFWSLRPPDHAQGADAVITIIFKRAVDKRCIHRDLAASDSHRRRRGFVNFITLVNLECVVLAAFPTADIHVREAGRLPRTHGSIERDCPNGIFVIGP